MACNNEIGSTVPNVTVYMKRGDNFNLTAKISVNGVEEELVDGDDTIYFSIKESKDSSTYTLQDVVTTFTTEGYANISFTAEETEDLISKKYVYDCQWNRDSTEYVKTLVEGTVSVNITNITEEGV